MNEIRRYYQAIKDGSVTVGKWVRLIYEYIIKGLEDGLFLFDQKKATAAIKFIENFCRHHEGVLARKKFRLELWQKAFVSAIFGIVDEDGSRHFREVVLIVARKNGKTLMAAAIAACCAFIDGEYGGRIYFTAPKLEQAALCFEAFHQMVKMEPLLAAEAQKRRTDILIESSNTTIKPLAFSAKKTDGLNPSLAVGDEVASWAGDQGLKFYEVIKSAMGARRQPILLTISTAGYVHEGIYDELMMRSTRFLLGDSKETRLLPVIYQIDDPAKWNDIGELEKSNPNLGVSIKVDYLLEEIAIAEGSLSKKSEFLTKYCNIKQNSSTAWLPAQAVEKCSGEPIDLAQFREHYCVAGIDLSRAVDLTACCAVIEKDGVLNVVAKFFLPAEKLDEATARDGLPYRIYIERGLLQLSGENAVNYRDCFEWFRQLVEQYRIYPLQVGYDRAMATYLVQDLAAYGFHMDDVYQGFNLSPVIDEMEALIKDGRINIGDNDLLKAHLLNCALKSDNDGQRHKLVKIAAADHIDGASALLDSLTVRMKWADQIGRQLKNEG